MAAANCMAACPLERERRRGERGSPLQRNDAGRNTVAARDSWWSDWPGVTLARSAHGTIDPCPHRASCSAVYSAGGYQDVHTGYRLDNPNGTPTGPGGVAPPLLTLGNGS